MFEEKTDIENICSKKYHKAKRNKVEAFGCILDFQRAIYDRRIKVAERHE